MLHDVHLYKSHLIYSFPSCVTNYHQLNYQLVF